MSSPDVEQFVTAIRETIATQLDHLMAEHDRQDNTILLPAEGTSIDLDALARAVHQTIVNYQAPPF